MHGLLLLSHGSRDPRAAVVVEELVQALALRSGLPVRPCHLDFTDPAPDVALRQMAADGFTSVRVVPLLFTPGYHVTHDVPGRSRPAASRAGWTSAWRRRWSVTSRVRATSCCAPSRSG